MRIAIIDLGTNSVRFDIQQLGPRRRQVTQLHREKIMIRLGQGVFTHGRLDRTAMHRTIQAFVRFQTLSEKYKVSKIIAFGTSALRDVSDRERFLKQLHEKSGIQVRVISGAEEAQLIALGVLSNEKPSKEKSALIDIGGGSTEISICRGKNVLHAASFQLGTARLQQVFLKRSPPELRSVEQLRQFIRGTLSGIMLANHWPKVDRVIGSSGTIKAIAKVLKGSEYKDIEHSDLQDWIEEAQEMTTTELLGLDGIESKRVDMILAGAILLDECLSALGASEAVATEFSLRDGILEEELKLFEQGDNTHLALHLPDLREKAVGFGMDAAHLDRVVRLGDDIFDRLKPLHRLKPQWKVYLSAAILLRDTGESINLSDHEKHSYYIVKCADFPAADPWEVELIALLCRYHEISTKVDLKDLVLPKGKVRQDVFLKLLALLRVVDAVDSGRETRVRLKSVQIKRGRVGLRFEGRGLTGLEVLNVEKCAGFFEKATGYQITSVKA